MIYKLNLGRNCLKLIIKMYEIEEIFIPYYSCSVLRQAARAQNCKVKFYHIDKNFMPIGEFDKDAFILYINYYGLFEQNSLKLYSKYKNLIVDNTHGFYSKPIGLASFNSLRKFFPVQNGAYLFTKKQNKFSFESDNTNFEFASFSNNYDLFYENELKLNIEPIKQIALKVERQMEGIDFEKDKSLRINLFTKYSKIFDKYNLIKIPKLGDSVPYCYPICTKNEKILEKFKRNDIQILRLWEDLPSSFSEYEFLNNVGALPLDNPNYANKILQVFN